MKVIIKGELSSAKNVRIETSDFIYNFSICPFTGNLVVNKVDGLVDNKIVVLPRYTNEIEFV